jgi:ABC-type branched-subunit amino acid transport system substrate-binding protein
MAGSFPPSASKGGVLVVIGVLVLAASVGVAPRFRTQTLGVVGGPANSTNQSNAATTTTNPNAPNAKSPTNRSGPANQINANNPTNSASGHVCAAGKNGGSTDTGVTGDSIHLASTVAESGIGASFLGDARFGLIAVVNQVNRQGGICGRQLKLDLVDDGWNARTGEADLRNYIHAGVFALAVVPSSEGLNLAAKANNGDIDAAGIPVVGTDGMLKSQYADPWIWPVATSTVSTAHIAAKEMYNAGVRTFGMVYDKDYHFGQEGAAAFRHAVSLLPGAKLKADVGIVSGQQDYGGNVSQFEDGCAPCDGTFMLLEPDTAISWIQSDHSQQHYVFGKKQTDGPQPLFTSNFGQACGDLCNNMWVWTGYQPPYPPFTDDTADVTYVNAIRSVSSSADTANQFLEGAYIGMQLLVQALQKVGPDLTRARLKQVLDSMTFSSGLTKDEHWTPGDHYANTSMLGFTIQNSGGFNGFQYQNTGWFADPWPTLDH